jgi:hypothetical protein
VTGSAGGGTGEGGSVEDGEGGDANHYEEVGPEAGSGAADSTGSFGGSEPGTGGQGPAPSSSSSGGLGCGDGICTEDHEDCANCPEDCGGPCAASCGDGMCDASEDETCDTCAADCGACPTCGDGVCEEPAEDCDVCFDDCGICACVADDFETNNGSGTATPVAIGTEYPDLSVCAADVDWLEFPVNGTRTITITFNQAEGDLDLEIFSEATGSYVTGSYSHDDDEVVVLSGQPSGTYWARVYGYMGATNPHYAFLVD